MSFFDEMRGDGALRDEYRDIANWLDGMTAEELSARRDEAEAMFRRIGITFAVYGEGGDPERLIPFDLVPRIFGAAEWNRIESGVIQRTSALNTFLADVYGPGEILKAGIIPEQMVRQQEPMKR